jgi:RNA polymerase sigma factor (sigma-70 family)
MMNLFSTTLKRPARHTSLDEESAAEVLLSKDVPTIPPPTDRELLTLWLEHKDTSALEAIIRRHGPLVRSLSSRLLRSHHEQADAFQTVFLVVSQNASRIRHRESLASWIYGVTVRTCLMFSRQRIYDPIPEETEAPSFPRQEVLEHQELVLTLNKELDLLPSHLRESLVLVYLEGYSRQAAADLTNTTEQTIKSRLARGRNLLRTRLLKRGVTFSTAFTLFSVTTTADADTLTIPDLLLNKTLDTCQTGQLPLTFPSVPLDPIAIVPTGVPLMSSTTFYGTLAVATLLLLTTLGMGNRGKADGQQAVTSAIDTSINESIPEIVELTPSVALEQQSATTTPAPATPAAEPVQQTSLTEKQTHDNPSSSSPVNTMELSLLDREIELFKAAEKGYRDTIKKFESMSMDQLIEFYKDKGVEPEQGRKSYLDFSNHRLALCTDHLADLEDRRQKLIDASKNYSAVAIDLIAEEAKLRLQLDAALAEYEQLLDRRLRIVGYHVLKKDILGNLPGEHLVPHIDEKTAELKIEMPELQAKIIDLTQRHAQVKAKLNAPVGSAVRTVGPPTTPIAPPAVADVDLSPNPIHPQPAPNLPPLKQSEQSLLDLKVERAELQLHSMQRLKESNPALVSRNDLQLKLLDAKIALQEALLERERFRAEQKPASQVSQSTASPTPAPAEVNLPEPTQVSAVDVYPVDPQGNHLSTTPVLTLDDMERIDMPGYGMASFIVSNSSMPKFTDVLSKFPTAPFVVQIAGKNYLTQVIAGGMQVSQEVPQPDLERVRDQFNRMTIIKDADKSPRLVPSDASRSMQPANAEPTGKPAEEDRTASPAEKAVDPAKQAKFAQLKTRYRHLIEEYRQHRPELIEVQRNQFFPNALPAREDDQAGQKVKIVSYLENELRKIESHYDEQSSVELSELRQKVLEQIKVQIISDISKLESYVVKLEIETIKGPVEGHQVEHFQKAIEFSQQQLAKIQEELKASSFTAAHANGTATSPPSESLGKADERPADQQTQPLATSVEKPLAEDELNVLIDIPVPAEIEIRRSDRLASSPDSPIKTESGKPVPLKPGVYDVEIYIKESTPTLHYYLELSLTPDLIFTKSIARMTSLPVIVTENDLISLHNNQGSITRGYAISTRAMKSDSGYTVAYVGVDAAGKLNTDGSKIGLAYTRLSRLTSGKTPETPATESTKPTEPQPENPSSSVTPPITTPKTLGVKFSNDFKATITFDKLTFPGPDTGVPQPIPAGVHPVTLTYKASDNDQTFSQPLILEVLPEINELDVGEIAGEFRLTLFELALIQQGIFGRGLVVYGTPNDRVTASGRVGSGAAVSEINTILDLEAIRSHANEFSNFERPFGRDGQPKGRIVAILHSPDYDEKIRFRHQFYLPSRGGTRNGFGRMDWTLLTPDDIPAIGTVVELFHVNADASSIDELRIVAAGENAPATRQYKIGEVTANEIYLSQIDQNIGSLQPDPNPAPLRPLSRLFFPQQARDQDLILVPKDKYTPETLSTEIWNKLHPPAKD